MNSMTGFGKGTAAAGSAGSIGVELSSVNRKQLELRISMPPELTALEPELRKKIGGVISRGAVQVRVVFLPGRDGAANPAAVNPAMLEALLRQVMEVRKKYGLPVEAVAVEELMRLPGVMAENSFDPENTQELLEALMQAADTAIGHFQKMRAAEGANLQADFMERIEELEKLLAQIEPLAAGIPAMQKERLLAKIAAENLPVAADDERLLKEILFYADKADVTEEITRLHSHFGQFRHFMSETRPVGRSLDFLMQEFFREITTLGNKAGIPAVSPLVVAFKSELEKLREQIQNVE